MSDSLEEEESLSERFQDKDEIDWTSVGNATVGSALTLVVLTIADGLQLIRLAVAAGLDGVGSFLEDTISLPFDRSAGIFETGAETFADAISFLGPLAFPVSVLVAVLSLLMILWGVSRLNG